MRTYRLLVTVLFIACLFSGATISQTQSDIAPGETSCGEKSSKIMILGTYHMGNPGLDSVNLNADDVLSPRRQIEISELVGKLARFQPTKIMIEAQYRSASMPNLYKKYLAGEHKLGRDEIEQIGFQLAKRLKLETVYPVDFPMSMNGLSDREIEYPKPKPAAPSESKSVEQNKTEPPPSEEDKLLRRSTVTEYLRYLNGEKRFLENHAQYMKMLLPNDDPAIYARADLVTNWYKRNVRIFTNMARITEFGKDRVLLIIGAGHLKILRDFAIDSPDFCLVDVEMYLK